MPVFDVDNLLKSIMPPDPLRQLGFARPRKSRDVIEDLDEEEEASLTSKLGSTLLGGLEMGANVLDIPGAMVRNALVGENPFTPLVHPLSGEGRTSGRGVLEKYGLAGQNSEGWIPQSMGEFVGDTAGLAADILLDPTTYMTFGGAALTKKGVQAAKSAQGLTRGLREGIKAGERGLVGIGLPFKQPKFVLGTGARAQKVAGKIDDATDILMNADLPFTGDWKVRGSGWSPGRLYQSMMDNDVIGATSLEMQAANRELSKRKRQVAIDERLATAAEISKLQKVGRLDDDTASLLRREGERLIDPNEFGPHYSDPLVADILGDPLSGKGVHGRLESRYKAAEYEGVPVKRLEDEAGIAYIPRRVSQTTRGSSSGKVFDAADPGTMGRELHMKGINKGTEELKAIIKDPGLHAAIESTPGNLDAARRYIALKYSHKFEGGDLINRMENLAATVRDMPDEVRAVGGYDNHMLKDTENANIWRGEATETMKSATDSLSKYAKKRADFPARTDTISVSQSLKNMGAKVGNVADPGALARVVEKMGLDPLDPDVLKNVGDMHIPANIGKDLARTYERYVAPESMTEFGKAVDSLTGLFKAGVLTHPARYVRDHVGGLMNSFLTGHATVGDRLAAEQMIRGKAITGAAKKYNEIVGPVLTQRGLQATDENATQILREMAYAHELIGANETVHGAAGIGKGSAREMVSEMPGGHPYKFSDVTEAGDPFRKPTGEINWESWNPLNIRGVQKIKGMEPRLKTGFKLAAGGEHFGYYADAMNRLTPWLNRIERGYDPAAAKKIADELQVSYNPRNYTKTEQQFLKRLFPFYSFTSRMAPAIAKELGRKPGGGLAHWLKQQDKLRGKSPVLPDYISDTASIDLGDQPDGSKRFLTGFGLMHEDPLSMLSSSPQGMGLEVVSRLNPLLKAPLEMITGKSFFQKGIEGGRDIEDLDPVLGRTLANMFGEKDAIKLPTGIEQVATNSPLARLFSNVRTLSDPRKGYIGKTVPLLTGFRYADVSPGTQDTVLRELMESAEKKLGSKVYEKHYFPADVLAGLDPEDRTQAEKLRALSAMLGARAKKRAKERRAAAK